MIKFHSKEQLMKRRPRARFNPEDDGSAFDIRRHVREMQDGGQRVWETVSTDDFGAAWQERQRYEVNAGRDEEPLLYQPIYDEVVDPSLPKTLDINKIGPGGVVFEEVFENGEVKFATVESSEQTVSMRHFGVGVEYTKDVFIFNELWRLPLVERAAGIAHNALLNHLHLYPILSYAYTAANQTAANTDGDSIPENYLLTLEDAITAGRTDTSNPRRGPYVLLISSNNMFTMERALFRVAQEGFSKQSSAIDAIRAVVAYDGWTGTRGKKEVTYTGVSANTAYLVSLQYQMQDFQSYVKQDLTMEQGNPDVSRFIREQVVWDIYRGVYANPAAAVEEITLPTTA